MSKKTYIKALLLLILFVSFQTGRMMCYHTHVYNNVVVAHSHPFANGSHTSSGLLSIASLDMTAMTDNILPDIDLPRPTLTVSLTETTYVCDIPAGIKGLNAGRAPPFAII